MNTLRTITAIALALSVVGAAQAQEATPVPAAASIASRADVAAEAARFVASGAAHESAYLTVDSMPKVSRDRAEVRAEAVRAVASGQARLLNSDGWTHQPQPTVQVRQVAGRF
jgi:hypothetical protein